MRKYLLLTSLAVFTAFTAFSQDFSNKGKEFWLVFPAHTPSSAQAQMGLFITSDKNSSGTISVNGFNTTFTVLANQVTGPINIPYANANVGTTNTVVNKGIHVIVNNGQPPVVLYAHIYAGFRSEASLILPVNTLGKKYYSTNFYQASTSGSQSQFNIVATAANTVVQYQKRINGVLSPTISTVNLPNPGDEIQVQDANDLTGSVIESIASGGECKRIAVFSGSSALAISSNSCTASSYDPLYQQCYPVTTWGKNFGVVPLLDNANGFHVRVMASEDNTKIDFNGTSVVLNTGEYYPASTANPIPFKVPMVITADKPISVSQYLMSANCSGSTDVPGQTNQQGDPDMVILNPVEQNISDINIFSSNLQNIRTKYLNVYIKTTGAPTFKINGGAPLGTFVPMPQGNGYSYLQENLSGSFTNSYHLSADSGFNAITYGMGDAESYAYSAGTSVKDLYTQSNTTTPYATVAGAVCTGTSFQFKISLPYKPDSIYWDLTAVPNTPAPYGLEKLLPPTGFTTLTPDSTTIVGGKTLYWYSLPSFYTLNVPGSYDVPITAFSATGECGSESDYNLPLVVSAPPTGSFTYIAGGCVAESYSFAETTPQTPFPTYIYSWDFGDPGSGGSNTSTAKNPTHPFSSPGSHTVTLTSTTTGGCVSSVASQTIVVPDYPTATISGTTSVCISTSPAPQITFTGSQGTPGYTFSYNINGVPQTPVQTTGTGTTISVNASTAVAGPFVYQLTGVKNTGSTLCTTNLTALNLTATVTVNPNAGITYASGNINQTLCINTAITPIVYTITNGSGANVTNLPPGVTFSYNGATNQLTISGTPTAAGTYNYLASPTGTCLDPAFPPLGGTIIVSADATLTLTTPGTNTQTVCVNSNIATISYQMGGGATGVTVTGLPAGVNYLVSGNNINITGAPTGVFSTPQTYNYSIATVSTCVNPPALTGTIIVNPNTSLTLISAPATTSQSLCVNTAITDVKYQVGDGGTLATLTGTLPAGVTGVYDVPTRTFTISGTPTGVFSTPQTYNYTISTTGTCTQPTPLTGSITVNPNATLVWDNTSGATTQTICINKPIVTIRYTVSGGGTNIAMTGTFPTGVTGTYSAGVYTIQGTPTVSSATPYHYSISTTGTCVQAGPLAGDITVNPDAAIALNATSGPTTQAVCINTAIVAIKFDVTGNTTAVNIAPALPAGLTGVYSSGTYTISGTPTVSAVATTYTITATGTCAPATATVNLTVNPDATLVWDNTSGSTTQIICITKPIVPIRYNIGGGGTNIAMTGTFPPGVTGTYSAGVYTIQGTPTVSSATPYHYSISTTGTCVQAGPLAGDITVNPDAAIALNATSGAITQAVCINTAIVAIKFDVTGNVTAVNIAPALPTGLTGVYSGGTYTISGTPSVSIAATTYTITATGTCGPATATINLTVNPDATLVWDNTSGATTQIICITKPIVPIRYNIGGGGTNIAMTGTFPTGVTGTYSGGVYTIQGTPTVSSAVPYHYSISTTGTCVQAGPLAGDITVNPDAAIALNATSGAITQAVCINTAIVAIKFDVTGNATAVNISPALPSGLTGVYSGGTYTISGTPSVSTVATAYTITVTGTCGPATATINLTVNPDATLVWDNTSGTTTQIICINKPIVPIRYNVGGGGTNIAMTGTFPTGVTGTYSAGVYTIQGTPTVSNAVPYHYSISTTGTCVQAGPLAGDITVNPDAAIALNATSASTTQAVCINTAIGPIKFDVTGNATAVNIAPALPTGLTGVYSGGTYTISGTATAISPATTYTITASGTCDPATATINLSVNAATAAFSYATPLCEGNAASFTDLSTATPGITLNNTVWDFGDGSALENHAPGSTFTHLFPAVTSYTVKMYATSVSGCNSVVTQQLVTVNPIPRPNFTVDKTFYCIPNATVIFNPATSTIADGTSLIYTWNFDDPASGSSNISTGLTPSHTYSGVGPFNVKLEAKSSVTGCLHDTVIVVNTIHPQPKASFTSNKPSVCIGDDVVFTDNTNPLEGTTMAWQWDFGDGSSDTHYSHDQVFGIPGTFPVSLYITNSIGCNSDTITKPFAVYAFPKVNAGEDRFVLEGGSIKLDPVVTGQNLQFLWSPSKYLNDPTLEKPTAALITEDITYRLTVTGIGSCPSFDDVFIKVLKFPTIPNTFTPNNDGINDRWRIKYLESYPDCKIQVFTRTGQKVYEIHGYSDAKAWDGTLKGKALPLDTYYYVIEPGNGRDPITGYITILK